MVKEFTRVQGAIQTFIQSKELSEEGEKGTVSIRLWAERWGQISLELTHIMEHAEKMLDEIGLPVPYFCPSDHRRPTMKSDISLLQRIVPELQEEKNPEVFNKLVSDLSEIVDRINSYVFNKDSSLQQEVKNLHPNIWEEIEVRRREREGEFQEENIKIDFSSFSNDVKVIFPQSHLADILGNLFKDAINHGFEDGRRQEKKIVVSLTEEEESILLKFADNGKGMSSEECNRIFEKGKEEDKKYWHEGKAVIEKFGGSIMVNSEIGKGTTFQIKLLRR
ncbi:MAG: sensor histidine kinase [bacterium]|nr:sensor histidine kinase [bacterium]